MVCTRTRNTAGNNTVDIGGAVSAGICLATTSAAATDRATLPASTVKWPLERQASECRSAAGSFPERSRGDCPSGLGRGGCAVGSAVVVIIFKIPAGPVQVPCTTRGRALLTPMSSKLLDDSLTHRWRCLARSADACDCCHRKDWQGVRVRPVGSAGGVGRSRVGKCGARPAYHTVGACSSHLRHNCGAAATAPRPLRVNQCDIDTECKISSSLYTAAKLSHHTV